MLISFFLSAFSLSANALVLEPVYRAAELSGYEVMGEFVFGRDSTVTRTSEVRENFKQLHEICPLAEGFGQPPRAVHFVILAWSDREFPPDGGGDSPHAQRKLAIHRGHTVEKILRAGLADPAVSFEIVDMATRHPQSIRPGSHAQFTTANADIKKILVREGAAPSDELQAGLFGEYGQHSKAVVWVDCRESSPPPRHLNSGTDTYQLVMGRGRFSGMGIF